MGSLATKIHLLHWYCLNICSLAFTSAICMQWHCIYSFSLHVCGYRDQYGQPRSNDFPSFLYFILIAVRRQDRHGRLVAGAPKAQYGMKSYEVEIPCFWCFHLMEMRRERENKIGGLSGDDYLFALLLMLFCRLNLYLRVKLILDSTINPHSHVSIRIWAKRVSERKRRGKIGRRRLWVING